MSESKSFFGDCHEMVHIWAFDQVFKIRTVLQSLSLKVCLNIYFLLFKENHQHRISRAGEKISPTISLFFVK